MSHTFFSGSLDRVLTTVTVTSFATTLYAGTFADSVIDYAPGTISSPTLQQSGNAAIGLPAANDDGNTSPFTPPFHAANITIIGPGGHITLHFATPVTPAAGSDIGVFTNTGLVATTSSGSITSTTTPSGNPGVFSSDAAAISVSADNITWIPLNAGNPFDLTMPANAYLDSTLTSSGGIHASGGHTFSDPYLPLNASLSQFAGLTYPQMVTLFNGSWGGAWIDASSSGLSEINYIRFDVSTGQRLVLDAVTAVPEPASLAIFAAGLLTLASGRPRSSNKPPQNPYKRNKNMNKIAPFALGLTAFFAATSPAHAALFTMNGNTYNVDHITGTGTAKALLELDFGTNITPDAHLFAYQFDPASAQDGRTLLTALQSDNTGISFTDTYFPSFDSYLLNTLGLNGQIAPDSPTSFWNYLSSKDGNSWSVTDVGYDQTPVSPDHFYAWAIQHDDPNINHDWSDPNAPFFPPSHLPATITAVPEPASLLFLTSASTCLFLRRKR